MAKSNLVKANKKIEEKAKMEREMIPMFERALRDNRILAASNKGIRCSLNNRIAILAAIIHGIAFLNYD